jgi:hypothetical protein
MIKAHVYLKLFGAYYEGFAAGSRFATSGQFPFSGRTAS